MSADAVWLLYHVAKTGGQTLRNHLRRTLGPEAHVHIGRWGAASPLVGPEVLDGADLSRLRALTGHRVDRSLVATLAPRPVREVVVLRHPVARIVSHFHFANARRREQGLSPRTFLEFSTAAGPDPMVRQFATFMGEDRPRRRLDAALHALYGMDVVTVLEHLDVVTPHLLRAMGLPDALLPRANRAGVDFERGEAPPAADLEAWSARATGDHILYRAARARTARTIKRLGELVSDIRSAAAPPR